ncbi:hypothetical protein DQ04_01691030 [Trypanosoma grayi]|uniref:hypothetical protein n=1 Tax=Trypanosoma grayi TaxID=71804 RepID=UPI0004F485B9|nr:hypothetical protein DQ04_01691030 [Trypanosoma grayi]KEG12465.1 hypothetical protein DQ04_01691030 [Trypanosoma grayi]
MPRWLRNRPCERHRSRGAGYGSSSGIGENEGDDDDEEEPRPSFFTPAPEPPVAAADTTAGCGTALPHRSVFSISPLSAEAAARAASLAAMPVTDWEGLRVHVKRRTSATHVHRLDLSGMEMSSAQWSWFCQEVLPAMASLSSLRLTRMGVTDARLAELLRECCKSHTRRGEEATARRSTAPAAPRATSSTLASAAPRSSSLVADFAAAAAATTVARERRALRQLRVLDLSGNHLTYRSATPLGKLLLWASDTLDEVHLLGNPLQDYGFQVLGIYLAKLQLTLLNKEPHLFPPILVQQYLDFLERKRRASREARLQHTILTGSSLGISKTIGRSSPEKGSSSEIGDAQIHLGISFLDVRDCQSSARGISALLAGASRAYCLETVLLARNGAIPPSLISPKPSCADDGSPPSLANDSREESSAEPSASPTASRFSSFEELHYPCTLSTVNLCGVPLSKLCTPIGCRELFLNLFFCCPQLLVLDVSESFDRQQVPPSLLLDVLLEERQPPRDPRARWRLERELHGEAEFALQSVVVGRQACVGNILCELVTHAAFNAQRRQNAMPPAFTGLQELHLNGTGITDRAVRGLAIAVRGSAAGVLSRLVVLNVADNLLTIQGCVQLLHTFVLDWPSPPSVMSALALQGNAGIHREDHEAIAALRQAVEAAVQRRRDEHHVCSHNNGVQPSLPLSVHFGAAGAATFSLASDGVAASTLPPEQPQPQRTHIPGWGEEKMKDDERDEEECFPTFHVMAGGSAAPFVQSDVAQSFVEVPASASFQSPFAAPVRGVQPPVAISPIHARETPARFLSSMQATPSFLQRAVDPTYSSDRDTHRNQKQEQEQANQVWGVPRSSAPLLSPAMETNFTPTLGRPVDINAKSEPAVSAAAWDGKWAMTVASIRARSRREGCDAGSSPQQQQGEEQQLGRGTSAPSIGDMKSPSLAFDFGCLFASIDSRKDHDRDGEQNHENTTTRQNSCGNGGDAVTLAQMAVPHEANAAMDGETPSEMSPLLSDDSDSMVLAAEVAGEVQQDVASIKQKKKKNGTGRRRLRRQPLSGYLEEAEQPGVQQDNEATHTKSGTAAVVVAGATHSGSGTKEELRHSSPESQSQQQQPPVNGRDGNDDGTAVDLQLPVDRDERSQTEPPPLEESKRRRVRSFVMLYYHPEGHVLCRGWRLLHRDDPTGADARACLEREVWALLQPPEAQRGRTVVSSVSLLIPTASSPSSQDYENCIHDAGGGATTLQITTNERRSALAERLRQHANTNDGRDAFPLFSQALERAGDDTVAAVQALLDAAYGLLPAHYDGITAETLVHAQHNKEDELVEELGTLIETAIEEETNKHRAGDEGMERASKAAASPEATLGSVATTPKSDASAAAPRVVSPEAEDVSTLLDLESGPHDTDQSEAKHAQELEEEEGKQQQQQKEGMPSEEDAAQGLDGHGPPYSSNAPTLSPAPTAIGTVKHTDVVPSPQDAAFLHVQPDAVVVATTNTTTTTDEKERDEKTSGRPLRRSAGRMKTFVFCFPHREGGFLCRGWGILHRADAVGADARRLLEEDVLSFLQPPSDASLNNNTDDGGAAPTVGSVSFAWEGSSSTMQLHVSTNERRSVVSERLQKSADDDKAMLPRFGELLHSDTTYDTVRVVETYLQQHASEELCARVRGRYRTANTLVHYYHNDETAMLRELGVPSMASVESAVAPATAQAVDDTNEDTNNNDNSVNNGDAAESDVVRGDTSESAEVEREEAAAAAAAAATQTPAATSTPGKGDEKGDASDRRPNTALSSLAKFPVTTDEVQPEQQQQQQRLNKETAMTTTCNTSHSRSSTPVVAGIPTPTGALENNAPSAADPIDRAFAERLRRLQFLAYSAVVHGAILLDRQQRHKLRICKGKWGNQSVTIAVEWDVFLVFYFVKSHTFGVSSHKSLVLVHPIACGVQCFTDVEQAMGSRSHTVHIRIHREYAPDELGVSSTELVHKLQEQVLSGSRSNRLSRSSRTSQVSPVNNNSIASSSSSPAASVDSATTVPSASELLHRAVSIQLRLSSASKARSTVTAIRAAEERAVSMIRRTITQQNRQTVARPLPAMPAT